MNEDIEVNSSNYDEEFVLVDSKKETHNKVNTESKTNSYFDGTVLELFAYSYLCDFITIISAGVLRSWGVCLLNKYIYTHTVIDGKRLKFNGEGDELFAKEFRWNFFRIITLGIYSIWVPTRYKEWETSRLYFEDEKNVTGDSYFTGGVGEYFLINLLTFLLTVFSFGLLSPIAHVIKLKWELEHTIINRKVVRFRGSILEFFLKKIGWVLLTIITLGIYSLFIPIKTLRWEMSNIYLLRKNESNDEVKVNSKPRKVKKPVLYTIFGIIFIVILVLFINVISLLKGVDPTIENEMREVISKTRIELINKSNYNDLDTCNSKHRNIKELDLEAIKEFSNNKGKGSYYNYCTNDYEDKNYASINIVLRKKSTICKAYINTSEYGYSRIDCNSIRDYLAPRRLSVSKVETLPVEEY